MTYRNYYPTCSRCGLPDSRFVDPGHHHTCVCYLHDYDEFCKANQGGYNYIPPSNGVRNNDSEYIVSELRKEIQSLKQDVILIGNQLASIIRSTNSNQEQ